MPRVVIEYVGLLPQVFELCRTQCVAPLLRAEADQLADYPPDLVALNRQAAAIAERLRHEFGAQVLILPVGSATPRGLWLSLRHRLGRQPAAIINGRRVLRNNPSLEAIRAAVAEALGRAPTP
ncbi:hypothetical protein [Kallotenue papyrolyticum]|uniref:hypothetical protein n=1 Tax=Kallotenue papyrolyticum TaxID=1325125 RepID=UPI000492DE04|nr:hypothetical protein [Kallotenue papyrolyticum]